MTGEGTGNREQEVLLPRFLLKTLEFQGGSDYSCSLFPPRLPRQIPVYSAGLNSYLIEIQRTGS